MHVLSRPAQTVMPNRRTRNTSTRRPSRPGIPATLPLLLAVAFAAAGAGWWLFNRPDRRPPPPRNVLLITIDTLRADALGAYGNASAATPWLDRLAAGGVRFSTARAHNVLTLPSHANILAGRLPPDHGVRDNAGFRLAPGEATLATRLRRAGLPPAPSSAGFPWTPASVCPVGSTSTTTRSSMQRRARRFSNRSAQGPRPWRPRAAGCRRAARTASRRLAGSISTSRTIRTSRRSPLRRDSRVIPMPVKSPPPMRHSARSCSRSSTRARRPIRWSSSPPITVSPSGTMAKPRTASLRTKRRSGCRSSSTIHRCSRRASSTRRPRHVDIVPIILATLGLPPPAGLRGRTLADSARRARPPLRSPTSRPSPARSTGDGRRSRASSRTG